METKICTLCGQAGHRASNCPAGGSVGADCEVCGIWGRHLRAGTCRGCAEKYHGVPRDGCEAETIGQEKACVRCGFVWDLNDDEPPACLNSLEYKTARLARIISECRS